MRPTSHFSSTVFIFISISSFLLFALLSKYLVLSISLSILVFFYFTFMGLIELFFIRKKLFNSFKIKQISLHTLMAFTHLGFYYCFFKSLTNLPLMNAIAIYLAYPLFVPFILRLWMGRKFKQLYAFGIYLGWIGMIFTFDSNFRLNNILVLVAIFSSFLKAIAWTGYHRLKIEESNILSWFAKYFTIILASGLLTFGSWKTPKLSEISLIFITTLFGILSRNSFKRSLSESNQLRMINLFNSSIFICAILDPLFFHVYTPFKPLLCAVLIYFGLFFTFLQKNILPNSIYDL